MMIKRLFVLAAVTAVAAALVAGAGATGRDPFVGAWVGQEASPPSGDGSTTYGDRTAISESQSTWLWYETFATFWRRSPNGRKGKGRSRPGLYGNRHPVALRERLTGCHPDPVRSNPRRHDRRSPLGLRRRDLLRIGSGWARPEAWSSRGTLATGRVPRSITTRGEGLRAQLVRRLPGTIVTEDLWLPS